MLPATKKNAAEEMSPGRRRRSPAASGGRRVVSWVPDGSWCARTLRPAPSIRSVWSQLRSGDAGRSPRPGCPSITAVLTVEATLEVMCAFVRRPRECPVAHTSATQMLRRVWSAVQSPTHWSPLRDPSAIQSSKSAKTLNRRRIVVPELPQFRVCSGGSSVPTSNNTSSVETPS